MAIANQALCYSKVFFYNHLYHLSVLQNPFWDGGITAADYENVEVLVLYISPLQAVRSTITYLNSNQMISGGPLFCHARRISRIKWSPGGNAAYI